MPRKPKTQSPYQEITSEVVSKFEHLISKGQFPSLSTLIEELLNTLMLKERDFFMKQNQREQKNGFYSRTLSTYFGKLNLKIPRVRVGKSFRPAILPPRWKRFNKEYEEFVLACLANGYSKAKIKTILHQLQLPFSDDLLDDLFEFLSEKLEYFRTRPIPDKLFALFIDAYHTEIREEGRMQKVSIFTALGIDLDGYKHILGYWVMRGGEKLGFWQEVFQDLISRGLSKVLIIVTDDFSGLSSLISKLFPLSDHQLCLLHFYRNLKRKLHDEKPQDLYKFYMRLKTAQNEEEGRAIMEQLIELVKWKDPAYGRELEKKLEKYVAFLKYPEEVRSKIYTTNAVESINSGLEFMRMEHGGYFASQEMLNVNLFIQYNNLHDRWLRRPDSRLVSVLYKIRQLFTLRFELGEDSKVVSLRGERS